MSNEKTIMRKINEAILALQLERKYDNLSKEISLAEVSIQRTLTQKIELAEKQLGYCASILDARSPLSILNL